jgi:hypothetical protein
VRLLRSRLTQREFFPELAYRRYTKRLRGIIHQFLPVTSLAELKTAMRRLRGIELGNLFGVRRSWEWTVPT